MPMLAAEKRKKEQEEQRAVRIREIVECSFGLFADQGIESITMNEIARQSEIGVASLYRYFTTKEELVIEAAIYAWKMEVEIFNKVFEYEDFGKMDGYTQLKSLMETFCEAVITQTSFFRFAIKRGREDGSISFAGGKNESLKNASDDELYFTIMHSLFSLCQKLSLSGEMLEMDLIVRSEKQISLLIEIILSALK